MHAEYRPSSVSRRGRPRLVLLMVRKECKQEESSRVAGMDTLQLLEHRRQRKMNYLDRLVDISDEWRRLLRTVGIKTAADIAAENRKKSSKRIAIKDLTDEERNNLKIARKLVERYYNSVGEVVIMENLDGVVNAARGSKVNGAYELRTGKIYLRRGILNDLRQTLHTLLHEAVHKYTGADDCTAAFERALTGVSVNIILGLEKLK